MSHLSNIFILYTLCTPCIIPLKNWYLIRITYKYRLKTNYTDVNTNEIPNHIFDTIKTCHHTTLIFLLQITSDIIPLEKIGI